MDGQPATVYIVRLVAKEIEQLALQHGDDEVEGGIRVAHNEEQRRFPISDAVKLQLVIGHNLPELGDVKGGQTGAAGN